MFSLVPYAYFYEGGVEMSSKYFPVRKYNKYKPEIFCVGFYFGGL